MPTNTCPTCHGIGELEGGRGEPPRVDCPTCCWRLVDDVLGRALTVERPRVGVAWLLDSYVVLGTDGEADTCVDAPVADLPTILAAHGCRMPSDAALAWVRGETPTPAEAP